MKKIILSLSLLLSIAPLKMDAQNNIIDEVIWVVGDESILKSEVNRRALVHNTKERLLRVIPTVSSPNKLPFKNYFCIRPYSTVWW